MLEELTTRQKATAILSRKKLRMLEEAGLTVGDVQTANAQHERMTEFEAALEFCRTRFQEIGLIEAIDTVHPYDLIVITHRTMEAIKKANGRGGVKNE